MRLCRLAVLLAVFAGLSMPAAAQYTTKGATSGFTSKSTGAAKTTTAAPTRTQAKPAAGQPVFRPRPKEETPPENTEEEDELPSFEALEGNSSGQAPQENVPPPPPPKGEIWVYLSGFEYRDLTGKTMNCSWKVIVQNRTDTPIDRLDLSYQVLDEEFILYVPQINPNSFSETGHAVYSPKCPAMAHVKPKVSVTRCKLGTLVDQECFGYIVIK